MSKYYDLEDGKYPEKKNNSDDNEFFGNGWSVKKEDSKYILTYISGELQGRIKSIEISKEDYELTIQGQLNLDKLCIKYKVF